MSYWIGFVLTNDAISLHAAIGTREGHGVDKGNLLTSSLRKNPRLGESLLIQFFYHESAEAWMRGAFEDQGGLFSYISPEARVPKDHPLRTVRTDLLAQAPLRWMMKRAESHGLSFRSEVDLDAEAMTAPIADSYKSFGSGVYAIVSPRLFRAIGREPDVREDGSHINVNETVDATVFARWRADTTYRPANLVEWAQRKNVDPAQLQTSVRADDPRVNVPDQ
jgi:hypothetical protein